MTGWVCSIQLLLPSPAQSFSGPTTAGIVTFYCLKFETPPNWRARIAQKTPPNPVPLLLRAPLLPRQPTATWRTSYCLAMDMFTEPFPSNACLCWIHNSGFQQAYDNKFMPNYLEILCHYYSLPGLSTYSYEILSHQFVLKSHSWS
jgi:hypothetical protein